MHGSPLRCIGALTLASDFPERCDGGGWIGDKFRWARLRFAGRYEGQVWPDEEMGPVVLDGELDGVVAMVVLGESNDLVRWERKGTERGSSDDECRVVSFAKAERY